VKTSKSVEFDSGSHIILGKDLAKILVSLALKGDAEARVKPDAKGKGIMPKSSTVGRCSQRFPCRGFQVEKRDASEKLELSASYRSRQHLTGIVLFTEMPLDAGYPTSQDEKRPVGNAKAPKVFGNQGNIATDVGVNMKLYQEARKAESLYMVNMADRHGGGDQGVADLWFNKLAISK
jgi:hypothetical protein